MKRFIASGLILLMSCEAWGALPAATVWEVRTTGSDSNGGGFVTGSSGTDYSQQNASQFSGTDLDSTNGTTAPCTVTSASHNFVAADVGNLIQITAGTSWTTGFYEVASVASNAATLDRACGSSATLSAGTWAEGGGLLTPGKPAIVSGNIVYIKSGTYTMTAGLTFTGTENPVTSGVPISFIGYGTTHGDNGTKPLLTTATNSVNLLIAGTGNPSDFSFQNISFSDTAGTPGDAIYSATSDASGWSFYGCTFDSFDNVVSGDYTVNYTFPGLLFFNCELKNSTGDAIVNSGPTMLFMCYLHNNTGKAYTFATHQTIDNGSFWTGSSFVGNVFYKNSYGIYGNNNPSSYSSFLIEGNVFDSQTNDGINLPSTGSSMGMIENNIFVSNGGYGVNSNHSQDQGFNINNNAFYNNTSGKYKNVGGSVGDITLTGNPFVNDGSANFALNNTAGAGASCRNAGIPGSSLFGTGYADVGALRHQDPSSGGGTKAFPFVN